jgi:hypothetical protein
MVSAHCRIRRLQSGMLAGHFSYILAFTQPPKENFAADNGKTKEAN